MLGLNNNKVELSDYSPEWKKIYKREEKKLINNLGNIIKDIQHIGSTSIPGMIAKPIIDIVIGVKNYQDFYSALKPLYDLDYKFLGNGGKTGRLFFVKGEKEITKYHLHLVEIKNYHWSNYLFFRDYIKNSSKKAELYKQIKIELEERYRFNREKYRRYKSRFVKNILRKNQHCSNNQYQSIYKNKSLFLQRYMDKFVLQKGIGDFIREVLFRSHDMYKIQDYSKVKWDYNYVKKHLNNKFTNKELKIMKEEKERSLEERIDIWRAISKNECKSDSCQDEINCKSFRGINIINI